MKITLNGEEREVAQATSVFDLLHDAGFGSRKVAVEVNRQIVPLSEHPLRTLHSGDRVEVVHAIGGG